jgi:hypothetical protein
MTAQEFTTQSLVQQYAEFIACGLMTRSQAMEWLGGVGINPRALDGVNFAYPGKDYEHG